MAIITNLFGELALDSSIKALLQKFGRFSFDSTSSLRVSGTSTVTGSLSSVTTVATITTGNVGFGDNGKTSTSILVSQQNFQSGVGRNFTRS